MKALPSLDEAKRIAAAGKYDILPVSCEIGEGRDAIEAVLPAGTLSKITSAAFPAARLSARQSSGCWSGTGRTRRNTSGNM